MWMLRVGGWEDSLKKFVFEDFSVVLYTFSIKTCLMKSAYAQSRASVRCAHTYAKFIFYKSGYVCGKQRTHISMPILCVRSIYTWGPWSLGFNCNSPTILSVQLPDNALKGCTAIIIAPFTQTNYSLLDQILMMGIRKKPDFGSQLLVFPYVLLGAFEDFSWHTQIWYKSNI